MIVEKMKHFITYCVVYIYFVKILNVAAIEGTFLDIIHHV